MARQRLSGAKLVGTSEREEGSGLSFVARKVHNGVKGKTGVSAGRETSSGRRVSHDAEQNRGRNSLGHVEKEKRAMA